MLLTALVDNSVVHWLLDAAKIAGALVALGAFVVGIDRLLGRRMSRGIAAAYRRAVTQPRDERFAQTVHRVMVPELESLRGEVGEQMTAVKAETRAVIEAHTVDEMAGVQRQIEVAERIEGVASEALALGKSNAAELQRLVAAVGLTPKETP